MTIHVEDNDSMRRAYANTWFLRALCCFSAVIFGTSITALIAKGAFEFWWVVPIGIFHSAVTYIFGFRVMRASSFSETSIGIRWPMERELSYGSITHIINLSPYSYCYYALLVITKDRNFLNNCNICYAPTDQGIIEHLRSKGVKISNLWFWQER